MATATGVCLGEPGQTPRFYTEDLGRSGDHDDRAAQALVLVNRLIAKEGVTLIGIEAPIKKKTDKTATNNLLMGIQMCVRGWSRLQGVKCEIVQIRTLDKHFLDFAGLSSADRKAANMAQCKKFGWAPKTLDEADAGAVWDYMCSRTSRSHAIQNSPLFQGRGAA